MQAVGAYTFVEVEQRLPGVRPAVPTPLTERELRQQREYEWLERRIRERQPDWRPPDIPRGLPEAEEPLTVVVYALVDDVYRMAKIGYTTKGALERMGDIQGMCPGILQLLGFTKVGTEAYWHGRFEEYRVHHEWFRLTIGLMRQVAAWENVDNDLLRRLW